MSAAGAGDVASAASTLIGVVRAGLALRPEEEARLRAAGARLLGEVEGWVERFYARLLLDPESTEYHITTPAQPVALPPRADGLIKMASNLRPELAKLRLERDAALKFVKAENALSRPRLTLQGTAGTMPI